VASPELRYCTFAGRKAGSVDNVSDMLSTVAQPDKLSPSQAAEVLQIHKRTLRRWSGLFAVALSPSAGATGKKRYYNSQDIQTLRRVEKLKKTGMSLSEIASVLPVVPADQDEATSVVLSSEANVVIGGLIERQRATDEKIDDRFRKYDEYFKLPWYRRFWKRPE